MDSKLINVLYDDPFDADYIRYDNDTEFWSNSSEMGMQLTETLNGILPIVATEEFKKEEHSKVNQSSRTGLNYEHSKHLTSVGTIEIVRVDPNADGYDTDSENEEDSHYVDDNINSLHFERQSQCSNATFRTRTDSSSIGDYESHTSDYDDDEDDVNNTSFKQNSIADMRNKGDNYTLDLHSNFIAVDDLFLDNSYPKSRTLSTNTTSSDIDGLGLQIDTNNFDLAEFITKDDFQLQNNLSVSTTSYTAPESSNIVQNNITINVSKIPSVALVVNSNNIDIDSDSDVIVDVETIELDKDEASSLRKSYEFLAPSLQQIPLKDAEEVSFVDNVKLDPYWSPTSTKKKAENRNVEKKHSTQKPNFTHNFTMVPNKKQCDFLKGKFAKGKVKTFQKVTKNGTAKTIRVENYHKKQSSPITIPNTVSLRKLGIGRGGNNAKEQSFDCNNTPKKEKVLSSPGQHMQKTIQPKEEENCIQGPQTVRRKLNLEEYKRRRSCMSIDNSTQSNTQFVSHKIPTLENEVKSSHMGTDKKKVLNIAPAKHSDAVTAIVRSLKEYSFPGKVIVDPITEAKNKVLRMQELKRAQQMRIIDSTISSKVPRVTKLLPLKEIVKDSTRYICEGNNSKLLNNVSAKSDYEEIVIVSASCNTDISIPPTPHAKVNQVNMITRSLLKSSALLSTVTNTFQKVRSSDHKQLSSSSLIASIQDVVVKKVMPVEENVASKHIKDVNKPEHHGEDKIIMHLPKNRTRKPKSSISTQTDFQLEFPTLPLPKSMTLYKFSDSVRKRCNRHYRKQTTSSLSEMSTDEQSESSSTSTISRSRDNSCSSSLERMRMYDSAIGTGGYSSRSSFKHRSSISSSYSESASLLARGRRQRRTSYTKRLLRKRSQSPYSSSSYSSDSNRSRSPCYQRSRSRSNPRNRSRSRRSSYHKVQNKSNTFVDRNVSQPAVEERRIVYVGRIEQDTTKDMLRRKFLQYGAIKQISIHFKDTGMKYGFVTFERSEDAFAAIDNSTRDPQINMYDISFGGRRAFCRASYADLDNAGINTYHSYVFPQVVQQPKVEESFETLLMKMKVKLNANKTNTTAEADGCETTDKYCQNIRSNKI